MTSESRQPEIILKITDACHRYCAMADVHHRLPSQYISQASPQKEMGAKVKRRCQQTSWYEP